MQRSISQLFRDIALNISSTPRQLALITIVVFLTYSNTLVNQLVWDDPYFVDWPAIRNFKNIGLILRGALPDTHIGDYRPLKGLLLMLDYHLWGANPLGHHAQAIAIHLAAAVLVYFLVKKLVKPPWIPFCTSLLFALHPVQVEAISFVTSSTDIIGICFYLGSFYAFILALEKKTRFPNLLISLSLFVLGIVSYEMVLTLPILLLWYLFCFKSHLKRKEIIYMILPYFLTILIYILVRFGILKIFNGEAYLGDSWYLTFLAMWKVLLKYYWLLIFPLALTVNHSISPGILAYKDVDYDQVLVTGQKITEFPVLISIAVFILMVVIAIKAYRKYPIVTFCIGWFFITLAPVSNIMPLSALMAERYLYLSAVGYSLLISYLFILLWKWGQKQKSSFVQPTIIFCFLTLLGFYTVRTYLRNFDWYDSLSLWKSAVSVESSSTLAHHNLGMSYLDEGDIDQAWYYLDLAASHNPKRLSKIEFNFGKVLFLKKDYLSAQNHLQTAFEYDPKNYEAYFWLGHNARELGKLAEAEGYFRQTLRHRPNFYDAHIQLGRLYGLTKRFDEATKEYELALKLNSLLIPGYYDLAALYIKQGKLEAALTIINKGLEKDPTSKSLILVKTFLTTPNTTILDNAKNL